MYYPYYPYSPYYGRLPNRYTLLSDWGTTGVGGAYSYSTGIPYLEYPGILAEATLMGWCPDCGIRHAMSRERYNQLAQQYYGQFQGPGPGFPGSGLPGSQPSQQGLTTAPRSIPTQTAMPSSSAAPRRNPSGLTARRARFPRAPSY